MLMVMKYEYNKRAGSFVNLYTNNLHPHFDFINWISFVDVDG